MTTPLGLSSVSMPQVSIPNDSIPTYVTSSNMVPQPNATSTSYMRPTGNCFSTRNIEPTLASYGYDNQGTTSRNMVQQGQTYENTYIPNYNEVRMPRYEAPLIEPQPQPQGVTRVELEEILKETLGATFRPSNRMVYTKPYPAYIDRMFEFPRGTRCPDFHLFSGTDGQTTMEHIGRFTLQCGELASNDFFKLRLFPSSLTGQAFSWWLTLKPDSIHTWQDVERLFHNHFYEAIPEITVSEISSLYQDADEKVAHYISRFRKLQSRCTTDVSEKDFVRMAQKGLKPELRKHFVGIHFYDLCHLVTEVSEYEKMLAEENQRRNSSKGTYYKNQVNHIEYNDSDSDDTDDFEYDEAEIALAELNIQGKKPYLCKNMVKPSKEAKQPAKFTFDVAKAELIFDILLKEKRIKLTEGHTIPKPDELVGKRYCKWHNRYTHNTNECLVLRSALQRAINDGQLALPEDKKADAKPDAGKKTSPANVGMVSTSTKESISSSQIVAQQGVYLNLKHPEVKQRYVDKEVMQEYADSFGMTLLCMRCACDLASPAPVEGKGKAAERIPVRERLSYSNSENRHLPYHLPENKRRTPVKQTDGLFYDRHRDSYYLERSKYDEYGPRGQPIYRSRPGRDTYFGSSSRMPKLAVGRHRESSPRMLKPKEPKDQFWHKNTLAPKKLHRPTYHEMTRTQLRRAQRLYGQKMKAKLQASEEKSDAKPPEVNTIHAKEIIKPITAKGDLPKATLAALKLKTEKLEAEKKLLQTQLASKEAAKLDDVDEDMDYEEDYSESPERIQFGTVNEASVSMVFTLPKGFKAPDVQEYDDDSSDSWEVDSSHGLFPELIWDSETHLDSLDAMLKADQYGYSYEEGIIISNEMNNKAAKALPFSKPTRKMTKHVKPLYINAKFDGRPIGRIMIDNGASVNVITASTLRRLGKTEEDLFEPLTTLTNFSGGVQDSLGMLPIEVAIGKKKRLTGFYVIDAAVGYNALLGRDWIHQNQCIPSTLHQSLMFWNGDDIEVVKANDKPFDGCVNFAEARYYTGDVEIIDCECFSDGTYRRLKDVSDDEVAMEASEIELFR